MLTLLEFCDEFKISHIKAKRMQKRGVLLVDQSTDPRAARIRETFMSRNPLGALDLCELIEAPSLVLQLGRYADKASAAVDDIGDAISGQAPHDIALSVIDAANGEADAIAALVDWIKGALPGDGSPVGYHWLAVRLMLPLAENIRKFENERIRRALARARKSPEFAGWWQYEKKSGRNVTSYFRPKALAQFNL